MVTALHPRCYLSYANFDRTGFELKLGVPYHGPPALVSSTESWQLQLRRISAVYGFACFVECPLAYACRSAAIRNNHVDGSMQRILAETLVQILKFLHALECT